MKLPALALLPLLLAAAPASDPVLEDYAAAVTGHFSTAAQHAADPRYDIVEADIVRIWPERGDGVWLYQEQAIVNRPGLDAAAAKAQPYFQRIGHVTRLPDGSLRRDNYELKDRASWTGYRPGWKGAKLTDAALGAMGCPNAIARVAQGHDTAATNGCENHYKNAASMRSLSITTPSAYVNWDRGFDAGGARVWGPEGGGYIFVRQP